MRCANALTILGARRSVKRFAEDEAWQQMLGARYVEWLVLSPGRHHCQFITRKHPAEPWREVSRRYPSLTFLLDYEIERMRLRGLIKAKAGEVTCCEINH